MSARRLLLLAALLLGLPLLALGLAVWLRPLSLLEAAGRAALSSAGLEKAVVGGVTVFRGGSGPTVLLLHGVNDQAGGWARVAGPLLASHHLVVPDLPGHGESEPRSGPLTVDALLAGVERVLAAEPRPATIVGNSMGGWLALLAALRHPGQVSRVVLLNGAAISGPFPTLLLPRDRAQARATLAALFAPGRAAPPGFVLDDLVRRAGTSPLTRIDFEAAKKQALDGRLGEVGMPVSLIWGAEDKLLDVDYARRVAAGLPQATLELLPGCGHMPQRECVGALLPVLQRALGAPAR